LPAASACPADPPTLHVLATPIVAGSPGHLAGAARPGSTVQLFAYSRPLTSYRLVRTTTTSGAGAFSFDVLPTTNTRLYAKNADGESPSVALEVRSAVTLRMISSAGCGMTGVGSVYPRRLFQAVDVVYVDTAGRAVRAMSTLTDNRGVYLVGRSFAGGCGRTLTWRAVSRPDPLNLAGTSPNVPATIRR
jgi:hypothetical protein